MTIMPSFLRWRKWPQPESVCDDRLVGRDGKRSVIRRNESYQGGVLAAKRMGEILAAKEK